MKTCKLCGNTEKLVKLMEMSTSDNPIKYCPQCGKYILKSIVEEITLGELQEYCASQKTTCRDCYFYTNEGCLIRLAHLDSLTDFIVSKLEKDCHKEKKGGCSLWGI